MLATRKMKEKRPVAQSVEQVNILFIETVLVYMAASYILSYVAAGLQIQIPTYFSLVYSQIILILPAAYYMKTNKINLESFVRVKKISVVSVILLIFLGIFLRPVMGLLSAVSMLWVENKIGNTANQLMTEVNFVLGLFFIALVPAILEEFVYRGVFYNEYRKVNGWKAILLSGLLFGLMHMNLNQFVYAFFMGVIFAFIIEATDSILASMIVHFTINGGSLLLLKLTSLLEKGEGIASGDTLMDSSNITRNDVVSMILPAIICLGVSAFLYYVLASHNGRTSSIKEIFHLKHGEEQSGRMITVPLAIAIILCTGIMIVNALA